MSCDFPSGPWCATMSTLLLLCFARLILVCLFEIPLISLNCILGSVDSWCLSGQFFRFLKFESLCLCCIYGQYSLSPSPGDMFSKKKKSSRKCKQTRTLWSAAHMWPACSLEPSWCTGRYAATTSWLPYMICRRSWVEWTSGAPLRTSGLGKNLPPTGYPTSSLKVTSSLMMMLNLDILHPLILGVHADSVIQVKGSPHPWMSSQGLWKIVGLSVLAAFSLCACGGGRHGMHPVGHLSLMPAAGDRPRPSQLQRQLDRGYAPCRAR